MKEGSPSVGVVLGDDQHPAVRVITQANRPRVFALGGMSA